MEYEYPTYLVHFNKNHSPKNGQFISGDGDGDGVTDDHHNYKTNKLQVASGVLGVAIGAAKIAIGIKYTKKIMIVGGAVKIAISAYNIAKGTGFVDRVKDQNFDFGKK